MKKVIKNKVYDTATAKSIGSWDNGLPSGDSAHCNETLYRKKTGEYFLCGSGGPVTRYAASCGQNSWSGGSAIIPLSRDAAQKWAEEKLTADEYESIFGPVLEDDSAITVTWSLRRDCAEKIRRMAADRGTSIKAIMEEIIQSL